MPRHYLENGLKAMITNQHEYKEYILYQYVLFFLLFKTVLLLTLMCVLIQ